MIPIVPFDSVVDADEDNLLSEEYLNQYDMLQAALESVNGRTGDTEGLPEYFDDMLMELIDSVPLE